MNWIGIAAAVAVLAGAFGAGHRAGTQACATERAESIVVAQVANQLEIEKAGRTGIQIRDIGQTLRISLPQLAMRTEETVREVTTDVDAAPALSGCLVPDRTRQLRQQQVDDSAATAAQHRAM